MKAKVKIDLKYDYSFYKEGTELIKIQGYYTIDGSVGYWIPAYFVENNSTIFELILDESDKLNEAMKIINQVGLTAKECELIAEKFINASNEASKVIQMLTEAFNKVIDNELNWDKAVTHINKIRERYLNGLNNLKEITEAFYIEYLFERLTIKGERTKELYDVIMALE